MALGQTLASPEPFICTPRIPFIASPPSINPNSSFFLFSSTSETAKNRRRFSTHGGVKCSVEYNNNQNNNNSVQDDRFSVPRYPRPSEISWQKELCNVVHLTGYVSTDIQIRQYSDQKTVSTCRLSIKTTFNETSWISLSFWNDLAYVADQHLGKGSQIYVCGRLQASKLVSEDGKEKVYYRVNVKQLNLIRRNHFVGDSNSSLPGKIIETKMLTNVEQWQAFFANPAEWWDNRIDKRNPKSPDFRHKSTGEILWINNRHNPPWVMSQLEILDSRREAFQEQNDGMKVNFGVGDNFSTL